MHIDKENTQLQLEGLPIMHIFSMRYVDSLNEYQIWVWQKVRRGLLVGRVDSC